MKPKPRLNFLALLFFLLVSCSEKEILPSDQFDKLYDEVKKAKSIEKAQELLEKAENSREIAEANKLIGNQSSDFDLLVPKRLLKEFLKRLKVLVPDIDIRLIILDEHPKIGKRLFNINLNNLSLKLGITELEGSLENEMKNKDLSINCLCYDVLNKRVVDSDLNEKALNDIKYQILSINGKISDTLKDSPSRVIRLIRFSLQFEFKLEKELLDYFRLIRAEKVNRMFNNSFNSQLKKLLKFVKDQSCLIRKLFDLLFLTNIIKHLSVWLDYGLKRIVFFLCAYDIKT